MDLPALAIEFVLFLVKLKYVASCNDTFEICLRSKLGWSSFLFSCLFYSSCPYCYTLGIDWVRVYCPVSMLAAI